MGNSPWGCKELDMAAQTHTEHTHVFKQSYVVACLDFSRVLHSEVTHIKHPFSDTEILFINLKFESYSKSVHISGVEFPK